VYTVPLNALHHYKEGKVFLNAAYAFSKFFLSFFPHLIGLQDNLLQIIIHFRNTEHNIDIKLQSQKLFFLEYRLHSPYVKMSEIKYAAKCNYSTYYKTNKIHIQTQCKKYRLHLARTNNNVYVRY